MNITSLLILSGFVFIVFIVITIGLVASRRRNEGSTSHGQNQAGGGGLKLLEILAILATIVSCIFTILTYLRGG